MVCNQSDALPRFLGFRSRRNQRKNQQTWSKTIESHDNHSCKHVTKQMSTGPEVRYSGFSRWRNLMKTQKETTPVCSSFAQQNCLNNLLYFQFNKN